MFPPCELLSLNHWFFGCQGDIVEPPLLEVLVTVRAHFCEIDGQGAGGIQFGVLVQLCFGVLFAGEAAGTFLRDWRLGCLGCCSGCCWMLVTTQARFCEMDGRNRGHAV